MRRSLLVALAVLCASLAGPAALADNEPCGEREACQNRSGDCREVDEGGYCSDDDLSPSFEDSPVRDSFNPVVCVLPDSCRFEGQSFFPPNPLKIPEYIAGGFKMGVDFGRALADVIFVFVENLATLMI